MERVEAIVVGAGVIGLAVARALAQSGLETVVLEAESAIGSITSSRNSEVIHAGIYYPEGSLKARLCVEGKHRLYAYLAERGLAHERCGKLIVAAHEAEIATLKALQANAHAHGVTDVTLISGEEARGLEPELACVAALLSPSTGVLDSHSFMVSLLGDFEHAGGVLALNTPVTAVTRAGSGFAVATGGAAPTRLACRVLVNSAGLAAPALAAAMAFWPARATPRAHYAKGSYFALSGRAPFRHLVYPAPEPGGLGVHFTRDLAGRGRFGPDVEWVERPDYPVDPARAARFYAAVRAYWPGLPDGALAPDYAGVRPKIVGPGEPAADFTIVDGAAFDAPGLVQLFGIESPGLTASLAIAEHVRLIACAGVRQDA